MRPIPLAFALVFALVMITALTLPASAFADAAGMRAALFGSTDHARAGADDHNAQLLAPQSYSEGIDNYERADDAFERGSSIDGIRRHLTRAEARFNDATAAAAIAAAAFAAPIQARTDAEAGGAPTHATSSWMEGERLFSEATRRLERSGLDAATRYAIKAEAAYRASELAAIKTIYLSETRAYIAMAKKLRADRYAPTSYESAIRLLASAETELSSNRYDTDKPRSLAADAKHNALHAIYIAKLENRIRNRDTTLESVLLEWESSISRLGDEMDIPVYFDHGETQAIDALVESLARLNMQKSAVTDQLLDRETELAGLNDQVAKMRELLGGGNQTIDELEVLIADQNRRLEQQARHRARFAAVEALFDPRQAMVLRQGDTIIIRMIGLNFDSGTAALRGEHLEILEILETAIAEFPESRVLVEGHTDAFGSDADNLGLSQARADAVVHHLLRNLPISPANLDAMGYGESRPVANNETAEGRKRNRRIDVVIKPQWIDARTIARVQLPDLQLAPTE